MMKMSLVIIVVDLSLVSGDSILLEVDQDEKREADKFINYKLREFNEYDFSGSNKKQCNKKH